MTILNLLKATHSLAISLSMCQSHFVVDFYRRGNGLLEEASLGGGEKVDDDSGDDIRCDACRIRHAIMAECHGPSILCRDGAPKE